MFRVRTWILAVSVLGFAFSTLTIAQDEIPWITDLSQARRLAQQQQRLVLLHFYGEGCPLCQQVDQTVFNQPELVRLISTGFIPVKIHVQQQPSIATFYKVQRIPTDIIVLPTGSEVSRSVSPGKINDYMSMLDTAKARATSQLLHNVNSLAQQAVQQNVAHVPSLPRFNDDPHGQSIGNSLTQEATGDLAEVPIRRPAATEPARQAKVRNEFINASNQSSNEQNLQPSGNDASANPVDPVPEDNRAPLSPEPELQLPPEQSNFNLPVNPQPNQEAPTNPLANKSPSIETPTLPPNVPPLALDGFCPVTLASQQRWVKGDSRFGAIHRNRTYLFASAAEQQRFLAPGAADRFAPVLSGYDAVIYAESGQLVDGRREHGITFEGEVYLFANEQSLSRFEADTNQQRRYVNIVRQAMADARGMAPRR